MIFYFLKIKHPNTIIILILFPKNISKYPIKVFKNFAKMLLKLKTIFSNEEEKFYGWFVPLRTNQGFGSRIFYQADPDLLDTDPPKTAIEYIFCRREIHKQRLVDRILELDLEIHAVKTIEIIS